MNAKELNASLHYYETMLNENMPTVSEQQEIVAKIAEIKAVFKR